MPRHQMLRLLIFESLQMPRHSCTLVITISTRAVMLIVMLLTLGLRLTTARRTFPPLLHPVMSLMIPISDLAALQDLPSGFAGLPNGRIRSSGCPPLRKRFGILSRRPPGNTIRRPRKLPGVTRPNSTFRSFPAAPLRPLVADLIGKVPIEALGGVPEPGARSDSKIGRITLVRGI